MADTEAMTGDSAEVGSRVESVAGTVELTRTGDTVVLTVTGALDLALAPKLTQLADRAKRLAPTTLVLDLTAVDFLASAGMAVLLQAHREATATVLVVAAGRVTLRPLQMTRLTDELAVYPTLDAALASR